MTKNKNKTKFFRVWNGTHFAYATATTISASRYFIMRVYAQDLKCIRWSIIRVVDYGRGHYCDTRTLAEAKTVVTTLMNKNNGGAA